MPTHWGLGLNHDARSYASSPSEVFATMRAVMPIKTRKIRTPPALRSHAKSLSAAFNGDRCAAMPMRRHLEMPNFRHLAVFPAYLYGTWLKRRAAMPIQLMPGRYLRQRAAMPTQLMRGYYLRHRAAMPTKLMPGSHLRQRAAMPIQLMPGHYLRQCAAMPTQFMRGYYLRQCAAMPIQLMPGYYLRQRAAMPI